MENTYKKLFTDSSIIIKGLSVLLEDKNIKYIVKDRFASATMAGFGEIPGSTELFVETAKWEIALKILENYKSTINS